MFKQYLSNSNVSPSNGLNGLPIRSQLEAVADTAKAVTSYKHEIKHLLCYVHMYECVNAYMHIKDNILLQQPCVNI
jgi:hypothetical protein